MPNTVHTGLDELPALWVCQVIFVMFSSVHTVSLVFWTSKEGLLMSCIICDRCCLWSYDLTAEYQCLYYYDYFFKAH